MAVASALVVLFLFCGISEYARLNLIAAGVRDAVQEAILSTVNDNYDDGFLDNLLGMEDYGSYHVKLVDGGRKEEYRISDLDVTIQNVPLTSDSSKRFLADATFLLRVPVRFGGSRLPDMQIRMKVQAAYTPVF